jgi:hypothetical protein
MLEGQAKDLATHQEALRKKFDTLLTKLQTIEQHFAEKTDV